jgi:hypothetical protein
MNFGKKENKEMIDKSIKDTPFLNGAETKEWMATQMFGMRKKMKKKKCLHNESCNCFLFG